MTAQLDGSKGPVATEGAIAGLREYGEGNRYGAVPSQYAGIGSKKRFGAAPDNPLVNLLKKSYKLASNSEKRKKSMTSKKDLPSIASTSTARISEVPSDGSPGMSRSSSTDMLPGLTEILNSDNAMAEQLRAQLLEYAKVQYCEENMLFLQDYAEWHRAVDTEGAVERGQALVHKYVINSAAHQINIPGSMQKNAIASAEGAQLEGLKVSLAEIASRTKKTFRLGVYKPFLDSVDVDQFDIESFHDI